MITQRPTVKMTVEPTSGPELTPVLLYAPEKKAKGTCETEETWPGALTKPTGSKCQLGERWAGS